jgi:hypothetical protein
MNIIHSMKTVHKDENLWNKNEILSVHTMFVNWKICINLYGSLYQKFVNQKFVNWRIGTHPSRNIVEFKYFGTTVTHQNEHSWLNSEQIKFGGTWYHSVQYKVFVALCPLWKCND